MSSGADASGVPAAASEDNALLVSEMQARAGEEAAEWRHHAFSVPETHLQKGVGPLLPLTASHDFRINAAVRLNSS